MISIDLSSSYLGFETLMTKSTTMNWSKNGYEHHIWVPLIPTCYIDQVFFKSLRVICLGNPSLTGYLVWLLQQLSSTFDKICQGILHITSSYTYMILHESQKSRECQASKLVHGGWLEKFNWSKLGFPRPYLLQTLSYENYSKRNVTLNDIPNNFHVET